MLQGDHHVWSVVRIPSVDEEDLRRSHRERDYLVHERTAHINRVKGPLFAQGIRGINVKRQCKTLQVDKLVTGNGHPIPPRLASEIVREIARLALVQEQIATLERQRDERPTPCTATEKKRAQLMYLNGIGPAISAVMTREVYYRQFANRRQVGALLGLAPSPYDSGATERCQGISRTGRGQVRGTMIQAAWLWIKQASAEEHSDTMVPGAHHGTRRTHQTHHDRRGRPKASDRTMALSRAWPRSAGRDHEKQVTLMAR